MIMQLKLLIWFLVAATVKWFVQRKERKQAEVESKMYVSVYSESSYNAEIFTTGIIPTRMSVTRAQKRKARK